MSRVSVGSVVRAAFGFVVPGWRAAWPVLIFTWLCAAVVADLSGLLPAPKSPVVSMIRAMALLGVPLLYNRPMTGALYRVALGVTARNGPEFKLGPGGFQWRRTEWRLFAIGLVYLAIIAVFVGATILMFIAWIRVFWLIIAQTHTYIAGVRSLQFLIFAPVLALGVPLAWLFVRLSLSQPATVDQARLVLFEARALSRGLFWPIAAAYLVVGAASGGLTLVAIVVSYAIHIPGPSSLLTEAPLDFLGTAAQIVLAPAPVGLLSFAYRSVRPAQGVETVFD